MELSPFLTDPTNNTLWIFLSNKCFAISEQEKIKIVTITPNDNVKRKHTMKLFTLNVIYHIQPRLSSRYLSDIRQCLYDVNYH